MVFDDMREKKCLSNGWMGIWEVGNGRVSRGMLETEHGLQKTEKERENGGWTGIITVYNWIREDKQL